MKDLIDLANLTFDILVKNHGEEPDSRTLFLYSVSSQQPQPWYVIGSNKRVMINRSGVSINFEDTEISELTNSWKKIIADAELAKADKVLSQIKNQTFSPKDGDTFNFWENDGPWKEIKL